MRNPSSLFILNLTKVIEKHVRSQEVSQGQPVKNPRQLGIINQHHLNRKKDHVPSEKPLNLSQNPNDSVMAKPSSRRHSTNGLFDRSRITKATSESTVVSHRNHHGFEINLKVITNG